jgi:hypothetical protein
MWRINMAKLTVSVSEEARRRIDEKAAQRGMTRSAYIEELVVADAAAELDRQLEEGYRALAQENLDFAAIAAPLAWEVLRGDTKG